MKRYFIKLAYNGANYHGWQIQNNGITVQECINKSLSLLLNQEINVTGAGRTDAGVHAKEFFAHFDFQGELSPDDKKKLIFRLNKYLNNDISIFDIIDVRDNAHARFDALSRTYKYYVNTFKDPFYKDFSYYVYGNLDIDLMNKAAALLFDYKDFSCFSKSKTQVKTNNCKIYHAEWEKENDKLVFTIKADRFLRNMVRAIVGTLIDVGKHRINIEDFKNIIESKNRSHAGYSVPAKALFLYKIEYPEEIFI
ncbi:MAG: tRNA pseudouridine(38-40) synthase TruA [Bacteroidales bacterium]|nr:tRNA pseudouridine(38-40) synthase TruA [Bacteroidales bacterium]